VRTKEKPPVLALSVKDQDPPGKAH
jgi:hypothetical protein